MNVDRLLCEVSQGAGGCVGIFVQIEADPHRPDDGIQTGVEPVPSVAQFNGRDVREELKEKFVGKDLQARWFIHLKWTNADCQDSQQGIRKASLLRFVASDWSRQRRDLRCES